LLCIISLNGGWTADPEGNKPGRDLGYTRYDIMAQGLGCYGEYVEIPKTSAPPWSARKRRSTTAWSRSSMSPDGGAAPRCSDAQNITVVLVKEAVIQSRFSAERVVWRRVQLKGVQIAGVAGSILGGTRNRDMPRFLMMPCARSVSLRPTPV
jgi:hypothetical protein